MTSPCSASLGAFVPRTDPHAPATVRRYRGAQAGGGHWIDSPILETLHASARLADQHDGLVCRFEQDAGRLEADVTALGLPEDWSAFGRLALDVTNGPTPCRFRLCVVCGRGRLETDLHLAPNQSATLERSLADLPLAQGMQPLREPSAIRLQAWWIDPDVPDSVDVLYPHRDLPPASPLHIHIRRLRLLPTAAHPVLVDRFGQRASLDWPGKIHSEDDLHRQRDHEARLHPPLPEDALTRFGGRADLPRREATGYFRVENIQGRWWWVDPEGALFWSQGCTGVRLMDSTIVTGRESIFEELPHPPESPHTAAWNPPPNSPANDAGGRDTIAFYGWNVLRKYGDPATWAARVVDRFRSWGVNTLGNWSEVPLFQDLHIPFTLALSTRIPGFPRLAGKLPDLDAPGWEDAFRQHVEERLGPYRDHPFLLGCFVDNEMGWNQAPGDPAEYAERYFSIVNRILKQVSPRHLYLGCRFVRKPPREPVCRAAGRHCDVVTVNSYDLWPRREEFARWHEWTGRPILIGEHHFPLYSNRQVPPPYPAFTAEERGRLYRELVEKWAGQPWAVGCHWYQHADQHPTGRPCDGENQTIGLVDITDTPHPELVHALRHIARHVWDWHHQAR